MFQSVKERTDYTTKAKAMIKKYGNQNIKHMRIHRQPLSSFMLAALNLLTLGDFKKRFRNSPYDTLFHLRVDLYMENGKVISAEKNDVITFTERPSTTSTAQRMDVPLSTLVTFNDFKSESFCLLLKLCHVNLSPNIPLSSYVALMVGLSEMSTRRSNQSIGLHAQFGPQLKPDCTMERI
jgi:hypothetical protein